MKEFHLFKNEQIILGVNNYLTTHGKIIELSLQIGKMTSRLVSFFLQTYPNEAFLSGKKDTKIVTLGIPWKSRITSS